MSIPYTRFPSGTRLGGRSKNKEKKGVQDLPEKQVTYASYDTYHKINCTGT